jgi:hypothetical protein
VVAAPGISIMEDEMTTSVDTTYLDTSISFRYQVPAESFFERFRGPGGCTNGVYYTTCIPRHSGGTAALLEAERGINFLSTTC